VSDPSECGQAATVSDGIDQHAAEWVVRETERDRWGPSDQANLDAWLAESWSHRTAYWRLKAAWNCVDRLETLQAPMRAPMPEEAAFPVWPMVRRAAAVLAAAAVIGAVWMRGDGAPREEVFATNVGGHEIVTLADGSQIELNTDTVLRVALDTDKRIVTLDKGEAYFQVVHDSAHPFEVYANNERISDIGTDFVVKNDAGKLLVSLLEGRAVFGPATDTRPSRATVLTPGDVAVAAGGTISVSQLPLQTLLNDLAWRRGALIFDDTALSDAATEFNRYNREKIVIADAAAGRRRIGGTFETHAVDRFAAVVRVALGLKVSDGSGEISISSARARK
jgi:transmembrane sensor